MVGGGVPPSLPENNMHWADNGDEADSAMLHNTAGGSSRSALLRLNAELHLTPGSGKQCLQREEEGNGSEYEERNCFCHAAR